MMKLIPRDKKVVIILSAYIQWYLYVGPGHTWRRILSICVILMWSNDMKYKYMFMIPLNNLARKGLITPINSAAGSKTSSL